MFSGIGGFELGIEQAYEEKSSSETPPPKRCMPDCDSWNFGRWWNKQPPLCIGYSEIDKYAIQIYEKNFGANGIGTREPHFISKKCGDCTKINWKEIQNFDLLTAGFPCQSFSVAGRGLGFRDTRGTLFFEIARCLKEKRPEYFLLENVKGLLSNDFGRTFKTIVSTLTELGYDIQWQVFNSKNFGVPQNRERVFIIGYPRGTSRSKIFPIRESNARNFRNEEGNKKVKKHLLSHTKANIKQRTQDADLAWTLDGTSSKQAISYALDANYYKGTSEQNFIKKRKRQLVYTPKVRRLTPTECERLQGFPDGWTKYGIDDKGKEVEISDTQRYKCLGNAVTVNVVEYIVGKILTA